MASRKTARPRARTRKPARKVTKRGATARKAATRPARPRPASRTRAKAPPRAPAMRASAPPRVPSGIGVLMHHMDYSSHDVAQVRRFYTEVLGFTEFNHEPKFDYLYIRTGPSSSLGFMPPMPGPPEQWRPPREPSICLIVEDVDRAHRALVAKGVVFEQAPADMPWGHRTAVLRDPEGRLLCLAQPIPRKTRP